MIVRVEVAFPLVGDDCCDVFDRLNFLRLELSQPVSVKERGSLGILASTEGGTRCGAGPANFFLSIESAFLCFLEPISFKIQLLAEFFSRAILNLSRGDDRAIAHAWIDFNV